MADDTCFAIGFAECSTPIDLWRLIVPRDHKLRVPRLAIATRISDRNLNKSFDI